MLMDKDYIKEKISNYKEIRNNLWATIVVLTGGTVALTITSIAAIKVFWIVLGFSVDIIFIYSIILMNQELEKLFNELKEI